MLVILFLVAFIVPGCTGIPKVLHPVSEFDGNRYLGKWYEIARLDHSFERNLSDVSAVYIDSLFNQSVHLFNVGDNTTFSLQTGGRHVAGLAENLPFGPGAVMYPVDPAHTGIGIGIPPV